MDYKQALEIKVKIEKDVKPFIKGQYDFEKRCLEEKKLFINKLMKYKEEIAIPFDKMNEEEKERVNGYINQCGEAFITDMFVDSRKKIMLARINKTKQELDKRKTAVFVWSYLYNGNVEKAIPYFNKYKELMFIEIEDPERYKKVELYDDNHEVAYDTLTGEGGYLKLCEIAKQRLETMEDIIKLLVDFETAKEVLKAGKKMNKRKGKKNRGKK
mgnify:CR=1 FL=1